MPYSDYVRNNIHANDFEDEDEMEDYLNWIDEIEERLEDICGYNLHQIPDQSYHAYWKYNTSVDDAVDAIIEDCNTNFGYNIKY